MAWLPKDQNEARRAVWETLIVVRQQINKALGCHLKQGGFEFLTRAVMNELYPGKKSRTRKHS
jgi:hypothetical protein